MRRFAIKSSFLFCVLLAGTIPAQVVVSRASFGFHSAVLNANSPSPVSGWNGTWRTLGATIKLSDIWACPNPNGDGSCPGGAPAFDFSSLDKKMQIAYNAGVRRVLFSFTGTPRWANAATVNNTAAALCNFSPGYCDRPDDLNANGTGTNATFITAYNTVLDHLQAYFPDLDFDIETWNEPGPTDMWADGLWQLSGLARITHDAAPIIRAHHSTRGPYRVLAPSLGSGAAGNSAAGSGVCSAGGPTGYFYMKCILTATYSGGSAISTNIDAVNVHLYPGTSNPAYAKQVDTLLATAASYIKLTLMPSLSIGTLPLINGEFSWQTPANLSDSGWQQAWYPRGHLAALPYVESNYWYEWDIAAGGYGVLWSYTGGYNPAGVSAATFANFVINLNHALDSSWNRTVSTCVNNGTTHVTSCTVTDTHGFSGLIVWSTDGTVDCAGACTTVNYTVPAGYSRYTTVDGLTFAASVGQVIQLGVKPLYLDNQAVTLAPTVASEDQMPITKAGKKYPIAAVCNGSCTFSLATGSAGTITSSGSSAVYTAPAHVTANINIYGCPVPPNHVYSTRVDALPLSPNSATYTANFGAGFGLNVAPDFPINVLDKTAPFSDLTSPSKFFSALRGEYGVYQVDFSPTGNAQWQGGLLQLGKLYSTDQHGFFINRDTCWAYESYLWNPTGIDWLGRSWTSEVGARYQTTGLDLSIDGGTVVGGEYALPLAPTLEEFYRGAIKHAMPVTLGQYRIQVDHSQNWWVWPGTEQSYSNCNYGGGSAPACLNYPRFGSRFRLSAAFTPPAVGANCNAACQGYVTILYTALKNYGLLLIDGGLDWDVPADYNLSQDIDVAQALTEVHRNLQASMQTVDSTVLLQTASASAAQGATSMVLHHSFWDFNASQRFSQCGGAAGTCSNRAVSCSITAGTTISKGMMDDVITFTAAPAGGITCTTSNDHSGWTVPGNGYVTPDSYAQVIVTDSAGATTTVPIILQPITVGIPDPKITIQSGVAKILTAWVNGVTGSTNVGVTWSMTPTVGTLNSTTGLYTAPTVALPTSTVITATAQGDSLATAIIHLTVIPSGNFAINMGGKSKISAIAGSFDSNGTFFDPSDNVPFWDFNLWGNRTVTNSFYSPFDSQTNSGSLSCYNTANPGSNYIPVFFTLRNGEDNDGQVKYYVPNGNYKITSWLGTTFSVTDGDHRVDFTANGVTGKHLYKFDHNAACYFGATQIPAVVTDNTLTINYRGNLDGPKQLVAFQQADPWSNIGGIKVETDTDSPHITVDSNLANAITYWNQPVSLFAIPWAGAPAAVTWGATTGTVDVDGIWTPPAAAPPLASPTSVTVTATSTGGAGTATLTFSYAFGTMTAKGTASIMNRASTMQFTALLNALAYPRVNWAASPIGSIDSSGLYTAPVSVSADTVVTITATSQDDGTQTAAVAVTVLSSPKPIYAWTGANSNYTDSASRVWVGGETRNYNANPLTWGWTIDVGDHIATFQGGTYSGVGTEGQTLYSYNFYNHVGSSPAPKFHWTFPSLPGGTYNVTLYYGQIVSAPSLKFNVLINGSQVATNVQPGLTPLVATQSTYSVTISDNQSIVVTFVGADSSHDAMVNGIAVEAVAVNSTPPCSSLPAAMLGICNNIL